MAASSRAVLSTTRRTLAATAAVALVSHVVAAAAGARLVAADFTPQRLNRVWQLLPYSLLRNDLLSSIAHLASQPPLYNLATGALLMLPKGSQPVVATGVLIVAATVVAVSSTGLLLEFGVRKGVAVGIVVVLVIADPSQFIYVGYWFYALPTAALVTSLGWAAVRWVRTSRPVPGLAYGTLGAALVLTNSTYQVYLLIVVSLPVVWVLRHHWRQVIAVLLVPFLFVVTWYANDAVQFGSTTTSSWLGMNLAQPTTTSDSYADLRTLIDEHVLSSLALSRPFSPLAQFGALGRHAPTGSPALDLATKPGGSPNFNNIAYLGISSAYLSNDLRWIEHRPLRYATHVTIAARIWLLPTDQYFIIEPLPFYSLGGYTTLYDEIVGLQAAPDRSVITTAISHPPGFSNVSVTALLLTVLALGVLPIVAWRRRRRNAQLAAGGLWIASMCIFVFVTTTLLELGENNRFRFELGSLPVVGATVAVAWLTERSRLGRWILDRTDDETAQGIRIPSDPGEIAGEHPVPVGAHV